MFDFDTIYDRRTSGDVKYEPISGTTDVIPMWVADMDLRPRRVWKQQSMRSPQKASTAIRA